MIALESHIFLLHIKTLDKISVRCLQIGTDSEGEEDELFFIWPTTLIHKINEDSPFYEMSAKDFLKKRCGVMRPRIMMMMMMMILRYEIVVMLEGVVEQTGNSIQVNTAVSTGVFRGRYYHDK